MILLVVFAGVLAVSAAAGLGTFALIPAVLGAGAYYWFDVWRRPHVSCRVCNGSGAMGSRLGGGGTFRRPFGKCWCCQGRKSHARFAARILTPSQHRAIRSGQSGKNNF
jgi:hypothetical protein